MSVVDDLALIRARDDLDDAQKHRVSSHAKAAAIKAAGDPLVGHVVALGDGYTMRLTELPYVREDGALVLVFEARHGARRVPISLPLIVHNVPIIHEGAEDPPGVLRRVVRDVLGTLDR